MSRARKISSDIRHVATLAGTTAAVVEGAAIAAEKARAVTDQLSGDADVVVVSADAVDAVTSSRRCCRSRRPLLVLLLLAILAAVGIVIWKKRAAALDDELADLPDDDRFAGSMP